MPSRAQREAQAQAKRRQRAVDRGAASQAQLALTRVQEASVFALKLQGLGTGAIADRLGLPPHAVTAAVNRVLDDLATETLGDARRLRAQECARIDALLAAVWGRATADRPGLLSVDRAVRLLERKAKLLGLDAPARTEAAVEVRRLDELSDADLLAVVAGER
jgi:DNA-binding CsgD family transcriptional regulator